MENIVLRFLSSKMNQNKLRVKIIIFLNLIFLDFKLIT